MTLVIVGSVLLLSNLVMLWFNFHILTNIVNRMEKQLEERELVILSFMNYRRSLGESVEHS